jgi:hypothetical protein
VGVNASPMTDQKCRLGSCMIIRLSFAVVPQDGGVSLKLSPCFGRNLPHTSFCSHKDVTHGLEGPIRLVHGFLPHMPHIIGK